MTIEPMGLKELLVSLQQYYNAGQYDTVDLEAWNDEYGQKSPLFLGCLFVAIRRAHSKTYRSLPDVAIAVRATPDALALYDEAQNAARPLRIADSAEAITDEERELVAAKMHELVEKLCGKARISK